MRSGSVKTLISDERHKFDKPIVENNSLDNVSGHLELAAGETIASDKLFQFLDLLLK